MKYKKKMSKSMWVLFFLFLPILYTIAIIDEIYRAIKNKIKGINYGRKNF